MRLLLLGAPGAGKGTQAKWITQYFHIPQISTGDMLREVVQSGSPLGKTIRNIISTGQLVPDEMIGRLIQERIRCDDCKSGFLLDGFPRNLAQAKMLADLDVKLDYVISINVSDEEVVKRITGRRLHPASGRIYHILYHPPKVQDRDDVTGEPLMQRDDDREETVRKRLQIYHEQTEPLLSFYQSFTTQPKPACAIIDGGGTMEEVKNRIEKFIGPVKNSK